MAMQTAAIVDQIMPSQKKQSQKKRHTKPCKFYQTNSCSQTADECDFLHVPVEAMIQGTSSVQHTCAPGALRPCRYYVAAGHCSNSQWCRYQHGPEALEEGNRGTVSGKTEERPHIPSSFDATPGGRSTKDANAPSTVFVPLSTKTPLYGVYGVPPNAPGYPTYVEAYHYTHMPAQPYYQPQAHTEQGTKSDDRKPTVPSSTPSPERSPGSTNNTGITEDPRYEEHTHSHQSRVYVCDDSPMVRVPPPVYASISPTPIIPVYPVVIQQSVAAPATGPAQQEEKRPETPQQVRSPKAKSRSGSRLRNISYKTKPCRYYIANGYCASGDQCTFIHGEATQNLSLLILNSAAAEAAKSKENATKPTSPSGNDDKKPTSPVTWRVIGGGVLMGDPTRCRSPSTTSSEGPTTPTSSSDNATDDEAVKDSEPKLEQSGGTVEFPRSIDGDVIDNDDGDVDRGTGKQEQPNSGEVTPTGRTRATSNPQSPSTAAVMRHDTLFSSAESPGVL